MTDLTLDRVMEKYRQNKSLNEEDNVFLLSEFNKAVQETDYNLIAKLQGVLNLDFPEHDPIGRIVEDAIYQAREDQETKDKKSSSIDKLIEDEEKKPKTTYKQPKKPIHSRGEDANYFIPALGTLINISKKTTKSQIDYDNLKNDIEQAKKYGANIRFHYAALALKNNKPEELKTENFRKGEIEKDFIIAAYALGVRDASICIEEKAKITRTIFKETSGHLKLDEIENPTKKDRINAGYQFKAITSSYLKNNKESLNSGAISFSSEVKQFNFDEMIAKYENKYS